MHTKIRALNAIIMTYLAITFYFQVKMMMTMTIEIITTEATLLIDL